MAKPHNRFLACAECQDDVLHLRARVGLSRWGIFVPLLFIAWLTKLRLIPFLFLAALWFVWAYRRIWSKNRVGVWECQRCGTTRRFDPREERDRPAEISSGASS